MTYAAELILNNQDRLIDLKVAMLESKLADLYDHVQCHLQRDSLGRPDKLSITFANEYDLYHWLISLPSSSHVENYHQIM